MPCAIIWQIDGFRIICGDNIGRKRLIKENQTWFRSDLEYSVSNYTSITIF